MTYLPEIIIEDILSRLPVKSLLRFRCVCKAWCTLISHPQFVKTHLRRQHERPAIGLITLRSKDDPPQKGDLAPVDLEVHLGLSSKSTAEILGSCHGLLCVVDRSNRNEIPKPPQKLILWNPSTRQRNHIPSPTFVSYKKCVFCFFYDSDADDYKIVRLLTLQSMDRTVIDVFTLKTNNWRSVEKTHSSVIESWSATYFNGNIHWIACNNYHQTMVAFSLREEKFQLLEMELPSRSDVFDLRVLGGCLCLDGVCFGDLWMMEEYGIKESWKRLITFPYRIGDDSNGMLPRVLLSLENDVFLVAHEGKLVLCESRNNTWKNITSFKWAASFYQMKVGLYIETLVSPNGGNKLTPMNRRGKAIEEKRRG